MKDFDLKKYLAEGRLLKEEIDPNSEIADYVKGMFNSSVYDYEGIQSDVWSKAEYAATSPGEGSVFMDLVDHLKSVGGKDVLEGNPDIYLELLPNEDIQWKAEIILNPQDDLRYIKEAEEPTGFLFRFSKEDAMDKAMAVLDQKGIGYNELGVHLVFHDKFGPATEEEVSEILRGEDILDWVIGEWKGDIYLKSEEEIKNM